MNNGFKKMLLISNMFPSHKSPTYGIFVQNFMKQMKDEGFEIKAVVIEGMSSNLLNKFVKYFQFTLCAVRAIRKNDFDFIYVHYIGHSLLPFFFVKRDRTKPFVMNAHGGDVIPISLFSALIQKAVTAFINSATLIIVPSNYFKLLIQEKFKIQEDKVFISPSGGIKTDLFKLNCNEDKAKKKFNIGYISRIDMGKGWDTLLHAVHHLVKEGYPEISLVMIGGGQQIEALNQMIELLNLKNNVMYFGTLEQNQLPSYLYMMEVFVFPSKLNESLGLVGIEAMACGVPIIGSNVGGIKSYIEDGVNGWLFEVDNHLELAKKICDVLGMNRSKRSDVISNAIFTASQYNSKIVSGLLAQKLRSLEKEKL